jgi:hypothetical protein
MSVELVFRAALAPVKLLDTVLYFCVDRFSMFGEPLL